MHEIIPALRAGLIVLADRYIYTLMARDLVRGADRAWTRNLYSPALVPDAVFYFRVSAAQLVERISKRTAPWIIGRAGWTSDCRGTCSPAS